LFFYNLEWVDECEEQNGFSFECDVVFRYIVFRYIVFGNIVFGNNLKSNNSIVKAKAENLSSVKAHET
jgi:hypothetical protein